MHLLIILCIIIIVIILYFKLSNNDMTYVKSNIDNEFYLVRNVNDKQQASNTLARIKQNILKLSQYLYTQRNNKENTDYVQYIDRLYKHANNIIIVESTQDSLYTSYSINKGEQIVFCLRSRHNLNNMHDINLMMYVVLHEISHVACPIYDNHGPLFKKIFAFITNNAMNINIYKKIDFNKQPEEYCGLMINDSIV
jgi:predicted metal-dependent hydrolase